MINSDILHMFLFQRQCFPNVATVPCVDKSGNEDMFRPAELVTCANTALRTALYDIPVFSGVSVGAGPGVLLDIDKFSTPQSLSQVLYPHGI
jgi:hypothetical protein